MSRQYIHLNPEARTWTFTGSQAETEAHVLAFHRKLPDYNETTLHSLPALARELGVGHVLVKDESNRFGLPAFKILGASWAVYRAVGAHLGLESEVEDGRYPIEKLAEKAREAGISIVTSTEGNCGRAIARMTTRYLGIPTRVVVPGYMAEYTREKIREEGAQVIPIEGSGFEVTIPVVTKEAEAENVVRVVDFGLEGYEVIPTYFVQGYSTLLAESDRQVPEVTGGKHATHAIVPCGGGTIAEAVTAHYNESGRTETATVIAVEPQTAASLHQSLKQGSVVSLQVVDTIMAGMNCGTLSSTVWPVLKAGVDVSVLVTDRESHDAVEELKRYEVFAGPCGAATLAALRRACADAKAEVGLDEASVVVLYCTEGAREYTVPS